MITERTIINGIIIGATLILVPFVISSMLGYDYAPALFFGSLLGLSVAFFVLKDVLCICPLVGTSIAGNLNFLPAPFNMLNAANIACILLILYYITGYVLIRQKRIKLGKPKLLWPILIITGICLYHTHSLSLGSLGTSTEGARVALLIYLAVFAYFCGINVNHPSIHVLSRLPLYCLVLTAISSIPFFLTTYYPGLAPYVYGATSNVNVDAFFDANAVAGATEGGIRRFGAFASIGGALELYLLAYYPIGTWVRPERWWVAGLSILCAIAAVSSGYRNVLFGFISMVMVVSWCHYSWRSIAVPVIALMGAVLVIFASTNNLIDLPTSKLPLIAQRSLSFLPGDWDPDAIESAKSSNDFRKNIQDVYISDYLDKSPWIGNGFEINTNDFNALSEELKRKGGGEQNAYLQAQTFIVGKLFHTGWISVYDAVGVIGGAAFLALGWSEISLLWRYILGPKANKRSPLFPVYVWLMGNILPMMISFFTVFGDFQATFIDLCLYGIVISQLLDLENTTKVPVASERKEAHEFSRIGGANYGYQTRY